MDTTRDQLAEALYQKGLALAEIESLKVWSPFTKLPPQSYMFDVLHS